MALNAYDAEVKRILNDESPAKPTTLSRAEIEDHIVDISESLKAPLSNLDRLDLVERRRDLRKQLEALNT